MDKFGYRKALISIAWLSTVLHPRTSVPSAGAPHMKLVRFVSLEDSGLVSSTLGTVDTIRSLVNHVDLLNSTKDQCLAFSRCLTT